MTENRTTPTLEDVAKAAGVSTATVSRCLNKPEQVVKATREKVLEAVKSLGYTPNFGARVMAAQRTFTIGAIVPTMENSIFARGLQAFQEELRRLGYTLLVSSTSYQPEIEEEQIRALVARGADGLLLIGYDRDEAIYDYLDQQGVPALITWAYDPSIPRPAIGFDNRTSMRKLAQAVLEQGHSRIGVISAASHGNDRAAERIHGIKEALAQFGLAMDALSVIETTYGFQSGEDALKELMQNTAPPTAIMCGNDVLAAGALRGAKAIGLEVPRDLSITGFDDMEMASVLSPSLTTLHVPHSEMGTKAAANLVAMLEGSPAPPPYELETSIMLRETLGPRPVS